MGLTYSAGVFHVNPSQQRGEVTRTPIRDTSSPPSSKESESQDLPLFSWKTSKESSARSSREMDGETLPELRFCSMSSENWKEWVTKQRQEYSARLKSAHLTNASGHSSWPTVTASEDAAGTPDGKMQWMLSQAARSGFAKRKDYLAGLLAPENPSTNGKPQECADWRTPCANEAGARVETLFTKNGEPARPGERAYRKQPDGKLVLQSQTINQQVEMVEKSWATPTARDYKSGRGNNARQYKELTPQVERKTTGKLNPRWVEHLMGLPPGWVSPNPVGPTEFTSRVDELRLLGNGVVPQTAEVAFVTLSKRFENP
jgi:hypothetical protein